MKTQSSLEGEEFEPYIQHHNFEDLLLWDEPQNISFLNQRDWWGGWTTRVHKTHRLQGSEERLLKGLDLPVQGPAWKWPIQGQRRWRGKHSLLVLEHWPEEWASDLTHIWGSARVPSGTATGRRHLWALPLPCSSQQTPFLNYKPFFLSLFFFCFVLFCSSFRPCQPAPSLSSFSATL